VWAFPATASTAQEVYMNYKSTRQYTDNDITQSSTVSSYESFKQTLLTNVGTFFSADTHISIDSFTHNNQLSLDGLTILESGSNISPTIYLKPYFEQYEKGMPLLQICRQIAEFYHDHRFTQNIDTSFFTCLEKVRPRIVYKLIHYDKNRELLEEIPHFTYLDLAIVFYCLVPNDAHENASILIHNSHLDYWDISKDTLLLFAQQNTPQLLPWHCDSLTDLLLQMLDSLPRETQEQTLEAMQQEAVPMHVLTNDRCYFGACCILYPDVLKEISDNLKDDLFLLPSSIHEVILVPASSTREPSTLRETVREVNLTEVAQDEYLSDSIYYYERRTNRVSLL
jgi:hypothetical protein